MTSSEYTLQSYFNEIKPIIDEFNTSRQSIQRFEENLHELQVESRKYNDILTIMLCWHDNIGRQLDFRYSEEQLLELHGVRKGDIQNSGNIYTITKNNGNRIKFYLCKHLIYTPISITPSVNQCLRC